MQKAWKKLHSRQQSAIIMIVLTGILSLAAFAATLLASRGDVLTASFAGLLLFGSLIASMIDRLRYARDVSKTHPVRTGSPGAGVPKPKI